MSHGTQDLYATSLQTQRGFDTGATTTLSVIAAFGAIAGGMLFGTLSQRFGRRACIMIAAVLGVCAIPLWAFSPSFVLLGVGAFAMQFMVQGAWGVIPAHLNELSPADTRGTFPGFTYQIGNLISAGAAQMEAAFATGHFPLPGGGADYAKGHGHHCGHLLRGGLRFRGDRLRDPARKPRRILHRAGPRVASLASKADIRRKTAKNPLTATISRSEGSDVSYYAIHSFINC